MFAKERRKLSGRGIWTGKEKGSTRKIMGAISETEWLAQLRVMKRSTSRNGRRLKRQIPRLHQKRHTEGGRSTDFPLLSSLTNLRYSQNSCLNSSNGESLILTKFVLKSNLRRYCHTIPLLFPPPTCFPFCDYSFSLFIGTSHKPIIIQFSTHRRFSLKKLHMAVSSPSDPCGAFRSSKCGPSPLLI
jgi:hypothetical protein